MNNPIHNLTQRFLEQLGKRNLDELVNLFADQVDWFIPGDAGKAAWLGRRNSKTEVREFFKLLWQHTQPVSAEIYSIMFEGNSSIIAGEFSTNMLQTGKVVDSIFFIHITEENGLIKRYRLLEDSFAVSMSLTS